MKSQGCYCSHQEACVQAQVTIHTSPPWSLCTRLLPESHDPWTTSLGEHTACLGLLQCCAGLCRQRLAPHPYPTLPLGWVSQSRLISCSINPILSGWEWTPPGGLHAEVGPIQSWTPGAVRTKKRKGNFSSSLRSSGLNLHNQLDVPLHLVHTWRDKESSQHWGGGIWEQLYTWGLLYVTDWFLVLYLS